MKNEPEKKSHRISNSLICGAISGAMAKSTVAPFERLEVKLQVMDIKVRPRHLIEVSMDILKKEGILSFWRGNAISIGRMSPFLAAQFFTFEICKQKLSRLDTNTGKMQLSNLSKCTSGIIAGLAGILLTYPLDLVHSRIIFTSKQGHGGFRSSVTSLYANQGILGFYRGIFPGVVAAIPYSMAMFFTNETCKDLYHKYSLSPQNIPAAYHLLFGAFSGLCGTLSSYPLDLVRKRIQVNTIQTKHKNLEIISLLSRLYTAEGIRGLYKGLSVKCIKNPIGIAVQFYAYEYCQQYLKEI